MRRTAINLFISFAVVLFIPITAFASISAAKTEEPFSFSLSEQLSEINSGFSELSDDPSYGGIYYEGNTLIVNIVGNKSTAYQQARSLLSVHPNVEVKFQYAKYSLNFLESVKDALTPKMSTWCISALDANEITNQIDVFLTNHNDEVQSTIVSFVAELFGTADFLNFVDYSGITIQQSVENVSDRLLSSTSNCDSDFSTLGLGFYSHGDRIMIGPYVYTLGPAVNSSIAYTAGHNYVLQSPVYEYLNSDKQIGVATPHFELLPLPMTGLAL